MKIEGKSTRFHERVRLRIPIRVQYFTDAEQNWTEETRTERVTVSGVEFALSRPVELKRIIRMISPMPRRFRLFDYAGSQYEVWGVISNLQLIGENRWDVFQLLVGTALIGKAPPNGFLDQPQTLYYINPFLREGSFWEARQQPRRTGPFMRSTEERRHIALKVRIKSVDLEGNLSEAVEAETLNISESGAAIFVEGGEIPRFILLKNAENNVLLAAVRGFFALEERNLSRLHLEFISGKWSS